MLKKSTAIIFSVILAGSFAGCYGKISTNSEANTAQSSTVSESEANTAQSSAVSEEEYIKFSANTDIKVSLNSESYVFVEFEGTFSEYSIELIFDDPKIAAGEYYEKSHLSENEIIFSVKGLSVGKTECYAQTTDGKVKSSKKTVIVQKIKNNSEPSTEISKEEISKSESSRQESMNVSKPESSILESSKTSEISLGKSNALKKAQSYLRISSFSRSGLIEQLEYEGFTEDEATYGVNNCGADWNEQALLKAKSYLKTSSFSYSGLVEQLKYEGFTDEQAEYGASNSGLDSSSQAAEKAKSYLNMNTGISYSGLVEQLEYEGFSNSEAEEAVKNCGADWNEQAALKAKSYMKIFSYSKEELTKQLEYEGFTPEQAAYGVASAGY